MTYETLKGRQSFFSPFHSSAGSQAAFLPELVVRGGGGICSAPLPATSPTAPDVPKVSLRGLWLRRASSTLVFAWVCCATLYMCVCMAWHVCGCGCLIGVSAIRGCMHVCYVCTRVTDVHELRPDEHPPTADSSPGKPSQTQGSSAASSASAGGETEPGPGTNRGRSTW